MATSTNNMARMSQVRESNICGTNNTMYNVESSNNRKIFILKEERMSLMLASDDE